MKAVILAGGFGTRLSEETGVRPKPMVEIGGRPILWHIMRICSHFGINDFVVCCGYKGHLIKEYFASYHLHASDVTFDLASGEMAVHRSETEPWRVTLVDTGDATMTGGRLKRVAHHLGDEPFLFTYGDGVASIDLDALRAFHQQSGVLATITAVQPPGRFGAFRLENGATQVRHFREKPHGDGAWINAGFFILEPDVLAFIDGDDTVWERDPIERLAAEGQLSAYRHQGYWQPMDTLRDRMVLEEAWESGSPPWKLWD
ncbi:MAG: glucose-1-phosphate cytidylyltransferase [Acidimicrobiales bacterium]